MVKMETPWIGIGALFLLEVCLALRAYSPNNKHGSFPLARKGFNVMNVTSFKFLVKACSNAHIVLQKDAVIDLTTRGNLAFIIGSDSNTKSQIRPAVQSSYYYTNHDEVLLDCSEFRPFWIRWKNGLLKLGKGDKIDINTIADHQLNPPSEINYAFLLTGWGSDGCWNIDTGATMLASSWNHLPGNKKVQGSNVLSYHTRSQMECNLKCVTPTEDLPCGCVEYSYNEVTKQCLVVDESDDVTMADEADWKTWNLA